MFDSTNVHVGGSHFNYNINAVSGTLRKSHPKSQMIIREMKRESREFDVNNPTTWNMDRQSAEEVVILQVMLIGNDRGLIEFVRKKDFEESWQ